MTKFIIAYPSVNQYCFPICFYYERLHDVNTAIAEKARMAFLNKYIDSGVVIVGLHFGNKPAGTIGKWKNNI